MVTVIVTKTFGKYCVEFNWLSSRWQYSYCLNRRKSSFLSQPVKRQTMTLLSKHEKRDSRRQPNAANLSESLYFWAFLELFYLFRDSKTTVSTWLETVARMSTVHGNKSYAGVWGNKSAFHVVTAGLVVPAAFAGVHRNHHFDTIQRLHPLLHPPPSGH